MKRNMTVGAIRRTLAPNDDLETLQNYYVFQIGSTFTAAIYLEQRIIAAMLICDRIRLSALLEDDVPAFLNAAKRHATLSSSTLGTLISILSKHGIGGPDLTYLRWVKKRRDFFVHKFFGDEPWPISLPEAGLRFYCRRLRYLEIVLDRATTRIYPILGRAGLVAITDLGRDGFLIGNIGSAVENDEGLRALTLAAVHHKANRKRKEARDAKAARKKQTKARHERARKRSRRRPSANKRR